MADKRLWSGEALESLKLNPGYKVLINEIIYPIYKDAWLLLKSNENPVARAKLQAIEEIVEKIDDKINLARQVKSEFKTDLVEHIQTTP